MSKKFLKIPSLSTIYVSIKVYFPKRKDKIFKENCESLFLQMQLSFNEPFEDVVLKCCSYEMHISIQNSSPL